MDSYVQIASDPKIKDKKINEPKVRTTDEQIESERVDKIIQARQMYAKQRLTKEKEWTDSYKMFMSWTDTTRNPFLSNLFIPKTHEAVELLSAFLIGTNQSIDCEPENNGDSYKAQVAGKWLDYLWRKPLKARLKILTLIKQGIVFGNGVVKLGWDYTKKLPFIDNTAIEDVYFDYFVPDIQDSEYIIHEIRRSLEDVQNDDKYDKAIRDTAIVGSNKPYDNQATYKFATYDKSLTSEIADSKVVVLEAWCKEDNKVISLIPTSEGWRIARNADNDFAYKAGEETEPFRPFVKLRFKTSPLANRAYDTGAVYPTIKIQKAFNDLINQYFDNVVIINNAMWVKRRGARINPFELIRRPGGVITVADINLDIRAEVTPDIKQSLVEMINRLDSEFQQASMVVNILKGIDNGQANTATEAQLGQQNVQTLLDMVDENIADCLSELGDMILAISLNNAEGTLQIKMFENDTHVGVLEFDPKNINSRYDIKIRADRSAGTSRVVRQKQLLDFINIVAPNLPLQQKYPNLIRKSLEKWLEEAGFSDTEYFFDESTPLQTDAPPQPQIAPPGAPTAPGGPPAPQVPNINQLLTDTAHMQSAGAIPKA